MRIGGFVPFTSIDYPGELAAVVFCQGCPWRCSYCHNPHLLDARSTELLDWQALLEVLSMRKGLLDAVVFSGGEPTLQDALPGAITEVKNMGFKVGLHTGGCYPDRLEQVLPLVDWVGLDIKDLPEHYPALTGTPGSGDRAWKSLELLQASGVPFEVRTTCYPELPSVRLVNWKVRFFESLRVACRLRMRSSSSELCRTGRWASAGFCGDLAKRRL